MSKDELKKFIDRVLTLLEKKEIKAEEADNLIQDIITANQSL